MITQVLRRCIDTVCHCDECGQSYTVYVCADDARAVETAVWQAGWESGPAGLLCVGCVRVAAEVAPK